MLFERYAEYYDLLYQDKNYEAESDFLEEVFHQFASKRVESILDLGCGSGGHAIPLAQRGYSVTAVDRSEAMLAIAQRKDSQRQRRDNGGDLLLHQADIRTLDLGRAYDAAISMFAVICYQITNEDLAAAFQAARRHLKPEGLFIFDAWFGPTILAQRPTDRYKVVELGEGRLIRFASPLLDVLRHTVQVNYKVLRLKDNYLVDEVDESHLMRYLFPQEIEHYLAGAGFRLLKLCPFMDLEHEPTERDWNVAVVAAAV